MRVQNSGISHYCDEVFAEHTFVLPTTTRDFKYSYSDDNSLENFKAESRAVDGYVFTFQIGPQGDTQNYLLAFPLEIWTIVADEEVDVSRCSMVEFKFDVEFRSRCNTQRKPIWISKTV